MYELLDTNNLCTYYSLDEKPGLKIKGVELPGRFDYLDSDTVQAQLLSFRAETRARLTLPVPQMHCTSCIWLLENLPRLNPGIVEARVPFLRKEIAISYIPTDTSLKAVVQLLASVGYEPQITLAELGAQPHRAGRLPVGQAHRLQHIARLGLGRAAGGAAADAHIGGIEQVLQQA